MKKNIILFVSAFLCYSNIVFAQTPGYEDSDSKDLEREIDQYREDQKNNEQKIALDLDDSIMYALLHDITLRQYAQDLKFTKFDRDSTLAEIFIPDVTAGIDITLQDPSAENTMIPGYETYRDNYGGNIRIQENLFSGLSQWYSWKQNSETYEFTKQEYQKRKEEIVYQVKVDFYAILLANAQISVEMENLQQLKDNYDYVKTNFEYGQISEYDLIQSQVQYLNQIPIVNATIRDAKTKKQAFLNSIDYPSSQEEVFFVGDLLDVEDLEKNDMSLEDVQTLAKQNDINLISYNSQLLNLKYAKKIANASRMPSIFGYFQYNLMYGSEPEESERHAVDTWTLGLNVSIPLSQWIPITKTQANVYKAKTDSEKMLLTIYDTEKSVDLSVYNLFLQINEVLNTLEALKVGIEQALVGKNQAQTQYEYGIISLLDRNDAFLQYTQAKTSYLKSLYDYANYLAQMDKMVGTNYDIVNQMLEKENNVE